MRAVVRSFHADKVRVKFPQPSNFICANVTTPRFAPPKRERATTMNVVSTKVASPAGASCFAAADSCLVGKADEPLADHSANEFAPLDSGLPLAHDEAPLQASGSTAASAAYPYETSMMVFRRRIIVTEQTDGTRDVNAEGVISRACYTDWLSRAAPSRSSPAEPEKTFQRILTCCVSGTDGRQPFTPEEEAAVLKQIRVKRVWPAFCGTEFAIGAKGYRSCELSLVDC